MDTRPLKGQQRVRTNAAGETGQEALYLRFLSERQVPVRVKLRDGEVVSGWIEYFDERMIRLTRDNAPNLFIYKEQIRTIAEVGRREQAQKKAVDRREENRDGKEGDRPRE